MEVLKGYFNDFILLKTIMYFGSDEVIAELAIQSTGIDEGKLFRLEQSAVKSSKAVDFATFNKSTYNVFTFNSLINEAGLKKEVYKLDKAHYYFLLEYNEHDILVDKVLGKGAFGVVKSAIDSHNKLVAIKQFKGKMHWQQELLNGKRLQKLKIPQGIVLPVDSGENNNRYNIVYPQGIDYSFKLASLNIEQLIGGIKQIVLALSWLHHHNIYHGDIKSDNIIFTQNGLAFIDFGLITEKLSGVHNMTYCCPDVLTNKIDFKIEVLALGVCFFRIFAYYGLLQKSVKPKNIAELAILDYQQQKSKNPNDWRPPNQWRSPYAATFDELELLQQGVFSREFLPSQRHLLNDLFQLIKDMLILNSQHRPSSEEISQRIHKLQGSF